MTRFREMKTAILSVLLIGVAPLYVLAGLNPAAPGLPTATYSASFKGVNNQFSSMCVDCHTRNPSGGLDNGSHFVSRGPGVVAAVGDNNATHSGGGWPDDSQEGFRENGAYFKVVNWTGSAASSKYGVIGGDNASRSYTNAGNHTGVVNTTVADYKNYEIICESCHNILKNVAGGNNLLETPPTQAQAESLMCTGCHGHMYDLDAKSGAAGATAPAGANDTVNTAKYQAYINETDGSGRKTVNTIHTILGVKYDMNHHVTTGDKVNDVLVGVGQAWRDTTVIDPNAVIGSASSGATTRGQMPQTDWVDTKTKTSPNINCVNCHAIGHGGWRYTGASILRDTTVISGGVAPPTGVERLGEEKASGVTRSWLDFDDTRYCNDCHTMSGAR